MKADRLDPLFDLLIKHEIGGAAQQQGVPSPYHVVSGLIAPTRRPPKPLTEMTVGEVLAWQASIDKFQMSEAAGAFQVMEDTLRDLVKSGKVDRDMLFNKTGQRHVAKLLLERRGLNDFLAGQMTLQTFADQLAREWASFPVMSDQRGQRRWVKRGQSYYAGDGLNKAFADPDEVIEALNQVLNHVDEPEQSIEQRVAALEAWMARCRA